MLKNFWQKIKTSRREKEINGYAKGLIFSMRAAIFNAKSKNPQMSFNDLIRIAIPLRNKDWEFLKNQNNSDYFIYKNTEAMKIEKNDSFADILSSIANIEICSMYFGVINKNGSLMDMLKAKDGDFFIFDWLRNRNTVEFLGIWERVYNPDFNYGEFAIIKSHAGLNNYKISVKEWG